MSITRPCIAIVFTAALGLSVPVACSGSPSTTARVCGAKAQLQSTLNELRNFDYANPNLGTLRVQLSSLQRGLRKIESGANLPQNQRLRDLGGVNHVRDTESLVQAFVQALSGPGVNTSTLQTNVQFRTNQVQRIVDAVSGC